jgi:transcriptional regulator with XRE-family HTH domain
MPLSIAERKHRMPYGAQMEVAREEGVAESYVSAVMNGEVRPKTEPTRQKLHRVQEALSRKLGTSLDDAFPEHDDLVAVA